MLERFSGHGVPGAIRIGAGLGQWEGVGPEVTTATWLVRNFTGNRVVASSMLCDTYEAEM